MTSNGETKKARSTFLSDLFSIGEVVPASRAERKIVDIILGYLRDRGFQAWIEPVPATLYWYDKASFVEACGRKLAAVTWPQTLGGDEDADIVQAEPILAKDYWSIQPVEDKIVVVELPKDPDDATTIYMHLAERGARGVIFYDRWEGRLRRIVVTGSWDYNFSKPAIAPIPALHVRREDGLWLVRNCTRARIYSEVVIRWSVGSIVMSMSGDGKEGEIWVTAHHDHWLGGANDNLAGVVAAIEVYTGLAGKAGNKALVFASFTAEEYGCPNMPGWYWACGSRYLANQLKETGRLENIILLVNFDLPASPHLQVHASGYEAHPLIKRVADEQRIGIGEILLDSSYTDSYSFSSHGVTSITIMDIDSYIEYYHTDIDTPITVNYEVMDKAVMLAKGIVEKVLENGWRALDYQYYGEKIYNYMLDLPAPPHLQAAAYRLLRETRKAYEANIDTKTIAQAYRKLTSKAIKPVFEGSYESDPGVFKTVLMPWLLPLKDRKVLGEVLALLKRAEIEEAIKALSSIPSRRVIPGVEEELCSVRSDLIAMRLKNAENTEQIVETVSKSLFHCLAEASLRVYRVIEEAYTSLLVRRINTGGRQG